MRTDDFTFELPEHLIAQYPPEKRGLSRLMLLDRKTGCSPSNRITSNVITGNMITELPKILCRDNFLSPTGEKPLLVFNDTKVRKARLTGQYEKTGIESEFLLLQNKDKDGFIWKVMVKHKHRKKTGSVFLFYNNYEAIINKAAVSGFEDDYLLLEFEKPVDDTWLNLYGNIPLPPYIKRKSAKADEQRYQTIYAKETGSAAAPTAGLHFTQEIMDELRENRIECAYITLHVGLGTFLPVRSENIKDHVMHEEQYFITDDTAQKIEEAKLKGRKIIAVGTTSVRTLESAWENGKLEKKCGSTSIFIYPGYNFKIIDAMFTNFHTPESTLLMLVSAFAGRELILESYAQAIREEYRFFSYGDAMLIY